jgi:hypothetical protein
VWTDTASNNLLYHAPNLGSSEGRPVTPLAVTNCIQCRPYRSYGVPNVGVCLRAVRKAHTSHVGCIPEPGLGEHTTAVMYVRLRTTVT